MALLAGFAGDWRRAASRRRGGACLRKHAGAACLVARRICYLPTIATIGKGALGGEQSVLARGIG